MTVFFSVDEVLYDYIEPSSSDAKPYCSFSLHGF